MAKRRLVIEQEFSAWRPNRRDDPDKDLTPMKRGWHVFADLGSEDEFVCFDLDFVEYEAERSTFVNSTRVATPEEVRTPPY